MAPSLPSKSLSHSNSTDSPPSRSLESTHNFITSIPSFASHPLVSAVLSDPSPPLTHTFEWTPLSLGWYESLLWGSVFTSEMVVGNRAKGGGSAGAVGVWNGTNIRLFQVQHGNAEGPSLMRPMGAVDAVGNNIAQKLGGLTFGRRTSGPSPDGGGAVRR